MNYNTTLVIGDPHSDPNHNNDRFDALGNFIITHKPDNIIQMGDFLSLDSVSFHDANKPLLKEGRRLSDDIGAGKDAYERMMALMRDHNDRMATAKKKQYKPKLYWFNANHEERLWRYIVQHPELLGLVKHEDLLEVDKDGWEIVPYRDYRYIEGISFTHIPMNRRNNQPISGEYVAKRALESHSQSVVFGHTHRLLIHETARNTEGYSPILQAINVGWYGDYIPDYVRGNEGSLDWWAGLVLLTHTDYGEVDIRTYNIDRVKRDYL